jgi:SanA protein
LLFLSFFTKLENEITLPHIKHYKIIGLVTVFLFITVTLICNWAIEKSTRKFISSNLENIQSQKIGLLLGTSKYLRNGSLNDFFSYRIEATEKLYKAAKIKYIIVSGDNSSKEYNEPKDMKNALVERGIPEDKIFLDFAGFRTFDSVIRAKEIFGQNSFVVISQEFHNQRAVYIARKNGIEAFGFNAKDVSAYNGFKTKIREYLARDKVFIDILLGISPKYLGKKIAIE